MYGQFLCVKRNSTCETDFTKEAEKILRQFHERGYADGIIENSYLRALKRSRTTLFDSTSEIPMITWALDYTPRTSDILAIVRKHWYVIDKIPGCKQFPRVGLRTTRSLRNILVRSDSKSVHQEESTLPSGHHKCGTCNICSMTKETKVLSFPDINFEHRLMDFSNFNTASVVYMLEYACSVRYIGSTVHRLKVHIQDHVSRIRNATLEAPLVQHFTQQQHNCTAFIVVVLPHIDTYKKLLQREALWIFSLETLHPHGLNNEIEFGIYL